MPPHWAGARDTFLVLPDMYLQDRAAVRLGVEVVELNTAVRQLAHDDLFVVDQARLDSVVAGARPRARRRLLGWLGAGLVILFGASLGAPALADGIQQLAHTGRFGPVTTESDGSEWISSEGDDYASYVASLYPEWLPLPSAVSADTFRSATTAQLAAVEGDSQAVSFESTFEHDARCVWVDEWLLAEADGDQRRMDAAAQVLSDSVGWPATVSVAGGGFLEHLTAIADAAAAGDPSVLVFQQQSDCADLPDGLHR